MLNYVKLVLRYILNYFGYDLIKSIKPRKSLKTERLTYFKTKTGNYYLPTDAYEDIVARAIIDGRVFEDEVVSIAKSYIKPKSVVLDVGANYGQMSVIFAEAVGLNGKVYSFEADEFIYSILNKNIEANNKVDVIRPIFGAVHDVNTTLIFPEQDFKVFGSYGAYGVDYTAKAGRSVKTVVIDDLAIEGPISFMKVDIQGGDLLAMRGAINTIRKNKMPIVFEYEYQLEERYSLSFQAYVDFISEIGYEFKKVLGGHNFLITPKS